MNCKECGESVTGSGTKYCSTDCKSRYKFKAKYHLLVERQKDIEGQENVNYVICGWCNCKVKRIYGTHIKTHHPGKTVTDYRLEFPGKPLTSLSDKLSTSKNSGQHMKGEKYREWASQRMLGEGNPNHSTKTTKEIRKSRSPFSTDFVNYAELEDKNTCVKKFAKEALKNRLTETQISYWVKKFDGNEELAKAAFSDRQRTFTLKKCIDRYGEEEGTRKWKERQKGWFKNLIKNFETYGDGRSSQSRWATEIIKECSCYLNIELPKTEKFIASNENVERYSYDFCYDKYIIEFNGDFWHANPKLFKAEDILPVLGISAKEKWLYDKCKRKLAESHGYKVMVVWESEYKEDPKGTVQKCIDFLNG